MSIKKKNCIPMFCICLAFQSKLILTIRSFLVISFWKVDYEITMNRLTGNGNTENKLSFILYIYFISDKQFKLDIDSILALCNYSIP